MRRAERQPETVLALYGGCFAKHHTIPDAGTLVPTHAHHYDHITAVTAGTLRAWRDGELLGDFAAPAFIRIPARAKHCFMALTDRAAFLCIHNAASGEADFHEGDLVAERHDLVTEE